MGVSSTAQGGFGFLPLRLMVPQGHALPSLCRVALFEALFSEDQRGLLPQPVQMEKPCGASFLLSA
jgi:hypothetical protein